MSAWPEPAAAQNRATTMDELRLQAVAARVVAWHNRHPLARRISAAQVRSMGYVALRFGAAAELPLVAPTLSPQDDPTPPAVVEEDYTQAFEALAESPSEAGPASPEEIEVVFPDVELATAEAQPQAEEALPVAAAHATEPAAETAQPELTATAAEDESTATLLEAAPQEVEPEAAPAAAPAEAATTLRERALSRAQAPGPPTAAAVATAAPVGLDAPVNDSHFVAPLAAQPLLAWVLRHGRAQASPPTDGPVRWLAGGVPPAGVAAEALYVLTAAIDAGALRSRVLLSADAQGEVFGPRLWGLPRLAAAVTSLVLLSAGGAWMLPHSQAPSVPMAAPVLAVAEAAGAATAESEAAAPAAAASAGEVTLLAKAPMEASPRRGQVERSPLGLHLSDEEKAAARGAQAQVRLQRGQAPLAAPTAAVAQAEAPAPAPEGHPKSTSAVTAPAPSTFAISTRPMRTRAEAQQVQLAMRGLLRTTGVGAISLDLLPQDEDWRVVAWPFAGRPEADQARALLAGRGMRVEVVAF